jgi:hypothetical protein
MRGLIAASDWVGQAEFVGLVAAQVVEYRVGSAPPIYETPHDRHRI